MILLLGGTSETAPIARAIAGTGRKVLVSTATDNRLDVGTENSLIERRTGRLDPEGFASLIKELGITCLVDATHPFAVEASKSAREASALSGVPLITYKRPGSENHYKKTTYVENHDEAAVTAFSFRKPVLLTTGSRFLKPYLDVAKSSGVSLTARVLPHEESRKAVEQLGLNESFVVYERGPFTVEQNVKLIKERNIGVIVSKDSGTAGGMAEKFEAARETNCEMIVIRRPDDSSRGYGDAQSIAKAVEQIWEI